jgi:uncharacterized repeat protein (TIGR03803 family)
MATLTTLVNFTGANGNDPRADLIIDGSGDLLGTTEAGGKYLDGTVFEISDIDGSYAPAPTILVSFNNTDGSGPVGGLFIDAAGDLLGTTEFGGADSYGTAFEIAETSTGYASTPTTLFSFNYTDGGYPEAGLIADSVGDLFGTTGVGGPSSADDGTVFEISYNDGSYAGAPTALGSFNTDDNAGGYNPHAGLFADAAGNLLGTTAFGGAYGDGAVFEIPYVDGSYAGTPTTLVSFAGANGEDPMAGLVADAAGDLFGTTNGGGANGDGTVFEIPYNDGGYASAPTTLVSFNQTNGQAPEGDLLIDAAGNLFGTTASGGADGDGTVFEIPYVDGSYATTPTTLFSFDQTNGQAPEAGLVADAAGDLFGTTTEGGLDSQGTVFELTDTGFQVPCYLAGTRIATSTGEVLVETLDIEDRVVTLSGEVKPIKWIGRRSYGGRFVMGRKDILPVCIKAGALDDNVPQRDLWISPNHAMYLGGVLIEAKDLVNGVSIVRAENVEKVEYFHIELDTHDVIVAEGAFSETFIDDDSRGLFLNAHEYRMLYADAVPALAQYCAPRVEDGYEVEAVRQHLALRAGLAAHSHGTRIGNLRGHVDRITNEYVAGWAQNLDHPEAPVCLDIIAGGKLIGQVLANRYREDLKQGGAGSGSHSFEFTLPSELALAPDEVEVRRSLDGAALERPIDAWRMLRQNISFGCAARRAVA